MTELLFLVFTIWTLVAALAVIFLTRTIHNALCLILYFLGLAGLLILIGDPLIAILQVLLYAGGIIVLFLFVVMLVPSRPFHLTKVMFRGFWIVFPLACIFSGLLISAIGQPLALNHIPSSSVMRLQSVTHALFSSYAFPFELVSLVLLTAIIGSVALTSSFDEDDF